MMKRMWVVDNRTTLRLTVVHEECPERYRPERTVKLQLLRRRPDGTDGVFEAVFRTHWSDRFLAMLMPTLGRILRSFQLKDTIQHE